MVSDGLRLLLVDLGVSAECSGWLRKYCDLLRWVREGNNTNPRTLMF